MFIHVLVSNHMDLIYEDEKNSDSAKSIEAKNKIQKLRKKLKECQQKKEEYLAHAQRAQADLINFRRRQEERMEEIYQMSNARLIKDLLELVDSIEAGIRMKPNDKDLKKIKEQLQSIFERYQVEEIKTIGEKFNPEFHEVVEIIESADSQEGIIVEEVQKGYLLNNKLLRPAKVKINKIEK